MRDEAEVALGLGEGDHDRRLPAVGAAQVVDVQVVLGPRKTPWRRVHSSKVTTTHSTPVVVRTQHAPVTVVGVQLAPVQEVPGPRNSPNRARHSSAVVRINVTCGLC